MKLCVISMSGGLDSTTLCYKAIEDGYTVLPINIKYGQKNAVEKYAFENIKEELQRDFPAQFMNPITLDLESMLETSLKLYQEIRDSNQVKNSTDMEFYTPSRNLVFSTLAAMVGEIATIASNGTEFRVGLGIHKHSQYDRDYWDITPEFINRLNHLFELNDCVDVEMYAPYKDTLKSEIVKDALRLGVPYKATWTCYQPIKTEHREKQAYDEYKPCLRCEACLERETAGVSAGITDINDYSILRNAVRDIYSK